MKAVQLVSSVFLSGCTGRILLVVVGFLVEFVHSISCWHKQEREKKVLLLAFERMPGNE